MKTVFITGASSGIGKAAAKYFNDKNWQVAATMRNPDAEKDLTELPNVKLYQMDVTDPEAVKSTIAMVIADFGGIDVLLNNAGYGLVGPLETASEEAIHQQFETNVFGVMRTIQAALPAMRKNGGVIINITSIGGLVTFPFNSLYHAAKFAVDGLSESLNYELRPFGIKVKVVAPGGVMTDFAGRSIQRTIPDGEQTPYDAAIKTVWDKFESNLKAGNYSTPEHIAGIIYEAATDESEQIRYPAGPDAENLYQTWKSMNNEEFFNLIKDNFGI